MKHWKCEGCENWFDRFTPPAMKLKGCMYGGMYGYPRKRTQIVYALFTYCESCTVDKPSTK